MNRIFLVIVVILYLGLPCEAQEKVEDVVLEECLPLQYDFRVISYEEGRYFDIVFQLPGQTDKDEKPESEESTLDE